MVSLAVAAAVGVAASGVQAHAQASPATTFKSTQPRQGLAPDPIDQSRGLSTRGVPKLGAAEPPAERLVPERRFRDPLTGREVVIPAHQERRLTDQRYWVPPLTGYGAHEGPVHIPGGERPPADQRQAP